MAGKGNPKKRRHYIPVDAGKDGAFWLTRKEYRNFKKKSKRREKAMSK